MYLCVCVQMKFKDIQGTGQVQLGSAHPIWHDGCSYDVEPVEGMLGTHVMMYKLCNTTDVRDVITRFKTPYLPYLHSWGTPSFLRDISNYSSRIFRFGRYYFQVVFFHTKPVKYCECCSN